MKGFGVITLFSVFFLKMTYVVGFFVGLVRSFLSYTCSIGVSGPAVADASLWVFTIIFSVFLYFIYQKFFT